ncbi:hypothetical protein [Evansella clarkii]|uniref:hypothetical protein n=1 Tax=Evansella clarkii TaxID=79879 RepID=UPI00099620DD|nr:hypothetical protein [Evansella clarkii]
MKKVTYNSNDVQAKLANKIASLEVQLANEQAAKQAIINYAEKLEEKVGELELLKGTEKKESEGK